MYSAEGYMSGVLSDSGPKKTGFLQKPGFLSENHGLLKKQVFYYRFLDIYNLVPTY